MLVLAAAMVLQVSSREVTFKGAGGFELNGTLLLPANATKAPAFLLLPGSGPTDRDGSVLQMGLKIDILREVAEAFANKGIASLRFDKRSVHLYATKWPKDRKEIPAFFSWKNSCGDATGAFEFLRSQPEIDGSKVGVLGHSEGALIALKIASVPSNQVRGLVLLAGQGRPLDQLILQQLEEKLPQQVTSDRVLPCMTYAKAALSQLRQMPAVPANPPAELIGLFNPSTVVFFHENLQDDPAKLAAQFVGDVLIMNGEFDNQVSPEKDAKALQDAFKKRNTGSVQLTIVPKASHAFKATPDRVTDAMTGPTIPSALEGVVKWCGRYVNSE